MLVGNVNRDNLVRYLADGLMAGRHEMRAYDAAIARVPDEDVKLRLAEFKADEARLYELTLAAVRSLGGKPNRPMETLAGVGAYVVGAVMGARADAFAEAREVKALLGVEYMARWDWETLRALADRADHAPTRLVANEGVAAAERHIDYLEPKARELVERAMEPPPPEPPGLAPTEEGGVTGTPTSRAV